MGQSISERKQLANSYRKKGNFAEALPLYKSLWRETADPFDGTGLLCCYRKSGLFDKAIPLAEELCKEHAELSWAAREICWTLVQGKLQMFDESTPVEEVIRIADTVFKYSPEKSLGQVQICLFGKLYVKNRTVYYFYRSTRGQNQSTIVGYIC